MSLRHLPTRPRADRRPRGGRQLRPAAAGHVGRAIISSAGWPCSPCSRSRRGRIRACAAARAARWRCCSVCSGSSRASRRCSRRRPAGDDYTGLLAIPAGLALLGLGAATLWSTRRTRWEPPVALRAPDAARRGGRRWRRCSSSPRSAPDTSTRTSGASTSRRRTSAPATSACRSRPATASSWPGGTSVAQRRRGDRVPRPQRPAGPHAHARPPRLRRAAVRPPWPGRERGRPERLRLGGREGRQGRDRVPAAPSGRRSRADRRPRSVRRRRADAPDRGRDRCAEGGRLGGRRLAIGGRGPRDARRRRPMHAGSRP